MHTVARWRIAKEPEFVELEEALRRVPVDDERVLELADALNAKGYSDREIDRGLA